MVKCTKRKQVNRVANGGVNHQSVSGKRATAVDCTRLQVSVMLNLEINMSVTKMDNDLQGNKLLGFKCAQQGQHQVCGTVSIKSFPRIRRCL